MSDAGVNADALRLAFRLAGGSAAADGVVKSAGGVDPGRVAVYADFWLPVAEELIAGRDRVGAWLDAALPQVVRLVEDDLAQKREVPEVLVRGAGAHPVVPLDPVEHRLRAHLGEPAVVPHVNGFGPPGPEGDH